MKTFIIIPAYNEEQTIAGVLDKIQTVGYKNIIVIDDGSTDKTSRIAENKNVIVLRHLINRGLGGALGTGVQAAVSLGADIIVTFDADGQHDVLDIEKLIKPIKERKADVVIGSRLLNPAGMPYSRRILNIMGNIVTYMLFGLYVTDSQSGMRAFTRNSAQLINIKTNRMEVSSEIIREIKQHKLKLIEVPIKAIYTPYSLSKGTSFIVGIKMVLKLLIHRLMT